MIGNGLNLSVVVLSQLLALGLMWYDRRENKLRDQGGRDYVLEGKTPEKIEELGNEHPDFRFKW